MENGTTHQKYLQDKHPEVKTVAYDSYQNAIIDLKNGRIDGVFGDTAVVNEWLKTNPQLGVATPKVTDPQYFGTGPRYRSTSGQQGAAGKTQWCAEGD
ncbi:cationic amino acid ABC transporter substrate-binding protein [Raoultella ornithinolytica]|nr:cationic amino acid ABC transporter substrate-binding protein [Raoultella ornithinolytica]